MSYITDFPHTRTYDSDLGFLIKEFKELLEKYGIVEDTLNSILGRIDAVVVEEINKALAEGKVYLKTEYDINSKTLRFIYKAVE